MAAPAQLGDNSAMDISAFAALAGSAIGAFASFATTWLTQHQQERATRLTQEMSRRERLYGELSTRPRACLPMP
jgi:HAMP domain-containing protein